MSVVTGKATYLNPHLNEHDLGGKWKDKMLALLWQQYIPIIKPFMELLVFSQLVFVIVCVSLCIWLATHTDRIYYTLHHSARDQSIKTFPLTSVGAGSSFSSLHENGSLFHRDGIVHRVSPKLYMSLIFIPLLEILLTESFPG